MSSSIISFNIGDFEVGISPYSDGALVIIHNGIPGVGTIIKTENYDGSIETDVLVGKQTQLIELLTIELAKNIKMHAITFILSFKPNLFNDFNSIKNFVSGFREALESKPHEEEK